MKLTHKYFRYGFLNYKKTVAMFFLFFFNLDSALAQSDLFFGEYPQPGGYILRTFSDRPLDARDSVKTNSSPVSIQSQYCINLKKNGSTALIGKSFNGKAWVGGATRIVYNGEVFDVKDLMVRIYFDKYDNALRASLLFGAMGHVNTSVVYEGVTISESSDIRYIDGTSLFEDINNCVRTKLYKKGGSILSVRDASVKTERENLFMQLTSRMGL